MSLCHFHDRGKLQIFAIMKDILKARNQRERGVFPKLDPTLSHSVLECHSVCKHTHTQEVKYEEMSFYFCFYPEFCLMSLTPTDFWESLLFMLLQGVYRSLKSLKVFLISGLKSHAHCICLFHRTSRLLLLKFFSFFICTWKSEVGMTSPPS